MTTPPIRVLLADDQDLIREGLAAILQSSVEVEVVGLACSGPDAVEQTSALRPDVVLMDIEMPAGDGLTATARIVAGHPDTKVLILTTFDLDEYVYQALRAGACGFLLKTTPAAQLAAAVVDCHFGDSILSPTVTRRLIETFVERQPGPAPASLATLTRREIDILREVATGKTNAEIAATLYLSEGTVKTHLTQVLTKLDLRDRVQAVVLAYETGLITPRQSTPTSSIRQ
jgi:DNA-binding NarL/FixJ family response regulator